MDIFSQYILHVHVYIYLSNSNLYSASSRNLLKGSPDSGPIKKKSLKKWIKSVWKMPRMRTDVKRQIIPDSRSNNRESSVLHGGSTGMRNNKVASGGRAQSSAA